MKQFKPVTFFTDKTPSKPRSVKAEAKKVATESNYYGDELSALDTKGKYNIMVQFRDANDKHTTWMNINEDSIPAIVSWLESMKKVEPKEVSAAKDEKKDEPKKEEKKDNTKAKDFTVSFDGSISVKNKKGEVILTLNAPDISPEDIEKLKKSDIQAIAEKFTKIKDLGLTIENTTVDFGEPAKDALPPLDSIGKDEKKDAAPSDDKQMKEWASNKLKSIEAKINVSGEKSSSASKVLKLMDEDVEYSEAVKRISEEDNIPVDQLEKELNPFI